MVKFIWRNKRAIFFSFVAIILIAAVMFSFSIYARYRLRTRGLVIETRVNTMNSFIKDIDKDIERGLFISSHRSILAMTEYVSSTGVYIDDSEEIFDEIFINGTINGDYQALMTESTFTDWISKTQDEGAKINLDIDFDLKNVTINQSDPWHVDIYIDSDIYVNDVSDIAAWNITRSLHTSVYIEGFEDPLYAVETEANILNTINKTPYEDFVVGGDTSNLLDHTNRHYYVAWSTGPSFLMRIEGNLSSSPYGIESLLNFQEMEDAGLDTEKKKTVVDHIYWSSDDPKAYKVQTMPNWFRMDEEYNNDTDMTHLEFYDVENMTIG